MSGFETVAVLGAGTMGHGIAQVCAMAGIRVRLNDVSEEAVREGMNRIRANLDKGVELGKVEPTLRDRTMTRIDPDAELETAVAGADLVIEAAPESLELKRALFRKVEAAVDPGAVLATNTSSLSIAEVAESLEHRGRFLGMHFFNPVHLMKLVEVVVGPETRPEVADRVLALARTLEKEPIRVQDAPGFASSRLGVVLGLEAMRMVEEGVASAEDIDKAMVLGYRHPMGPLKLTDVVGLDVRLGIAEYLHEKLESEAFRPPEILRKKVEAGELGKKSGKGFYDWEEQ